MVERDIDAFYVFMYAPISCRFALYRSTALLTTNAREK